MTLDERRRVHHLITYLSRVPMTVEILERLIHYLQTRRDVMMKNEEELRAHQND